ncbi:PdaC/SigV domain-containing protein [Paenibacillus hodogayensis]|uniref:PdaC/SigV domain-containing protein n=1 Tax=Paenibacillus hodogayensis TaxID=279208 RepID=A0ABV5W385_9BACL
MRRIPDYETTSRIGARKPVRRSRSMLLALCAGFLLAAAGPVAIGLPSAHVQAEAGSSLTLVSRSIAIDGKSVTLPTANVSGNTYIGLRSLNEKLNLTTDWNAAKRIITVTGRGRSLTLEADSGTYTLNDQHVYGLPAIIQDGTTYVPLRLLLEMMGYDISYDPATRAIGIETIAENILTIQTSTITEEQTKQSLRVHYPQIAGFAKEDVQHSINAFLKEEAETHAKWGREELAKAAAANAEETIRPVSYEGNYRITYNRDDRLSLYVDYYIFTGGAHGLTVRQPYTFDLTTGKLLSLKDVAKGDPNYVNTINQIIRTHISEAGLTMLAPFESIEPERDFFLKNDAVVIYFEQYEYTPYAAGMPEFEIPFDAFGR